jgi:hypothetical protein
MTRRGPKVLEGSCPTCGHGFKAGFYDTQNVQRFFCDWCSQWITAERKGDTLDVSTKDARYNLVRQDEKCPNDDCSATWELYFNPNGALAKSHGVEFVASGNNVRCKKCGTYATVTLAEVK